MEYSGIIFGLFLCIILIVFSYRKYRQNINWMVVGTWVIALMAIGSAFSAVIYYSKQIGELEKSRRFEWRPFLDISHLSKNNKVFFVKLLAKRNGKITGDLDIWQYTKPERLNVIGFDNFINEISEQKDEIRNLKEISIADSLFIYADTLLIPSARRIQYKNLGNTPLRIKSSYISVLTQNEWVNRYHKSARELISDIPNKVEYSREWETDYIVKASDKRESVEYPHLKIMPITELFDYYYSDSTMTIYWVTYFEYEDFFGYDYNTLLIEYQLFRINLIDDYFEIVSEKEGLEKYRWDVNIE